MTTLLEIDQVEKHFDGIQALSDVSLKVEAGEIVAVIGPNGAGKTTLLNLIHGFIPPTAGDIRFNGTTLLGQSVETRSRGGIGRTFQTAQVFGSMSVWENLLVAANRGRRAGDPRELARAAAMFCEAEDLLHRHAGDLPLGEARKVELARALCLRPELLLLDEPVSGMTDAGTSAVADVLQRARSLLGVAVLLIDHDMKFVMDVSDYIYVLDFGQVIAHGDPSAIAADEAVMNAYVGSLV